MAKKNLLARLVLRPDIIGVIGFSLQFVLSVWTFYYLILSLPYPRVFWYAGLIFLLVGFIVSCMYQREHDRMGIDVFGTVEARKVKELMIAGIYGKVRHPGYLGAILMQFGMAFCSQSVLPVLLAILLLVFWVHIAAKEEEYLVKKFKSKYKKYVKIVRWRFIPFLY